MRVKFLKDAVKWAGNRVTGVADPGAKTERYREGEVVDFAEAMDVSGAETPEEKQRRAGRARAEGQRWVSRGLAVNLDEQEAQEKREKDEARKAKAAESQPARPAAHAHHPAQPASQQAKDKDK